MRRLTLLRHSHAADAPFGGDDFDRPLSPRGQDVARDLGLRLAADVPPPDRLCVSPALRTLQTATLVCEAAWPSLVAERAATLYMATVDKLRDEIATTPDAVTHLMIVGHNPGLSELWSAVGEQAGFGGLAPCEWRSREFDVATWPEVSGRPRG